MDLEEYTNAASGPIEKLLAELQQEYATNPNVEEARLINDQGVNTRVGLFIHFVRGLRGGYVKIINSVIGTSSFENDLLIRIEWEWFERSRPMVNAAYISLSDWVDTKVTDPEYIVEDYVHHVRERIENLIFSLEKPK